MVLVPEEEAVPGVPVLEVAALVVQAEDKVGRADNQVQVDRVVRAAAAPAVRVVHKAAGNPARKAVRAAEAARAVVAALVVRAAQAVEAAPEEEAVLEAEAAQAAPVAEAALEAVDQVVLVEEVAPAEAAAREAALVQAEAAAVPAVAGKTDKLFFNINKSDSRRIAFVLLKDLKMLAKLKKINLKVVF
ncbi:MAG: hypothetical protein M3521_03690 [Acidobacteriota bacterium]|nr:hypothetical protein [Acidobacteriota bacterium]